MSGPPPLHQKPEPEADKPAESKLKRFIRAALDASPGDYFIALGEGVNAAVNSIKKKKGKGE